MIEYVTANYVWILGGLILVLLIIIGYYADKTNFGQGEQKEETKDDKDVVLPDKPLSELVQSNKTNDDKVIDQETKNTTNEETKKRAEEETKKTDLSTQDEADRKTLQSVRTGKTPSPDDPSDGADPYTSAGTN